MGEYAEALKSGLCDRCLGRQFSKTFRTAFKKAGNLPDLSLKDMSASRGALPKKKNGLTKLSPVLVSLSESVEINGNSRGIFAKQKGLRISDFPGDFSYKEKGLGGPKVAFLPRDFSLCEKGLSNEEIGKRIREKSSEKPRGVGCAYCGSVFRDLPALIEKALKEIRGREYETFWCGAHLPPEISSNEEKLWEKLGVESCEPIKRDILKETGETIEKKTGKVARLENPDVYLLFDFTKEKVLVTISSLFIYGRYDKLVRGIPQTKWFCVRCRGAGCTHCGGKGKMYEESVEELIAKIILERTGGKSTKFHGLGREDIDARCVGKRPFVIEVLDPVKRNMDFEKLAEEINEHAKDKVMVYGLRNSTMEEVRLIKNLKPSKTYRAIIISEGEVTKEDIKKIEGIAGKVIAQRTPTRVAHRRADLVRKREVLRLKVLEAKGKEITVEIEAEAGTYIKELISGDSGRTKPSFSELTGKKMECKELDVTEIAEEPSLINNKK